MVAELAERGAPGTDLCARAAAVAAGLNRASADLVALCRELLDDDAWAGGGVPVRRALADRARRAVAHSRPGGDDGGPPQRGAARGRGPGPRRADLARPGGRGGALRTGRPPALGRSARRADDGPPAASLLSRYVFDVPDEPPAVGSESTAERAQRPATLVTHVDGHGRFRLSFDAPADEGALVRQALQEAKDGLFADGRADVTPGDALVEVASRSLATVSSPQRTAHYRVYVHLSADSPSGWVNGRGAITPALAARFACDGVVQPVVERGGLPVSVGREQRVVPARTRRLIEDRDRGCVFPGCRVRGFVEIHHLTPWSQGGHRLRLERQPVPRPPPRPARRPLHRHRRSHCTRRLSRCARLPHLPRPPGRTAGSARRAPAGRFAARHASRCGGRSGRRAAGRRRRTTTVADRRTTPCLVGRPAHRCRARRVRAAAAWCPARRRPAARARGSW